jgi:hypothetical protein
VPDRPLAPKLTGLLCNSKRLAPTPNSPYITKANPSAIAIGVENPWDNKNKGQSEKPIESQKIAFSDRGSNNLPTILLC